VARIARAYNIDTEELLAMEEPASPKAAAPRTSGQQQSPEEWARETGARLHGMSAAEWDAHVRELESVDEIEQTFRDLFEERVMLHAALRADKWLRPENRELRAELGSGIRELRIRRIADLEAAALLQRAESLVNEIHEELLAEARSRQE